MSRSASIYRFRNWIIFLLCYWLRNFTFRRLVLNLRFWCLVLFMWFYFRKSVDHLKIFLIYFVNLLFPLLEISTLLVLNNKRARYVYMDWFIKIWIQLNLTSWVTQNIVYFLSINILAIKDINELILTFFYFQDVLN